jgi:hypothetical protein
VEGVGGEAEGPDEVGRRVGGLETVEGAEEGRGVAGEPGEGLGAPVHAHQHAEVGAPQPPDDAAGCLLGGGETRRGDVACLHRGRGVDHEDHGAPGEGGDAEARIAEGQDQERQEDELEQQGEPASEASQERRRLLLPGDPVPEAREGDGDPAPPQLEEVEDHQGGGRGAEERPQLGQGEAEEGHLRNPPARKIVRISSSKGRVVGARKQGMARAAQ